MIKVTAELKRGLKTPSPGLFLPPLAAPSWQTRLPSYQEVTDFDEREVGHRLADELLGSCRGLATLLGSQLLYLWSWEGPTEPPVYVPGFALARLSQCVFEIE